MRIAACERVSDEAKQLAFWQNTLSGALPVLAFHTDCQRPPFSSRLRGSESIELGKGLWAQIQNLCALEQVSADIFLLAAFRVLLLRYTGQEDVVVGTISCDSRRSSQHEASDLFTNPIALRMPLASDATFQAVLRQIDAIVKAAAAHRDYPFDQLPCALGLNQDGSAIFQTMLVYCNEPGSLSENQITAAHLDQVAESISRCDLSLLITCGESAVVLQCPYDSELFEPATVQRMLGCYHVLLESSVAQPQLQVSQLEILSADDKRRLLIDWNDTRKEFPSGRSLHSLIEAQAQTAPDAVAVVFRGEHLSYAELNRRANQLAHYLRKRGVGSDLRVGICMERSLEMIVGLVGVLKAGGAYVPLDPTYPHDRLAFLFEDAQPKVVLTQARLREHLPANCGDLLCIDSEWHPVSGESEDDPTQLATPADLAYMIYTSGSTGTPKGVMISHGAIVNHMLWMQETFCFTEADAIVQKTPYSFDASVWEIFAPLIAGSRLIVAEPHGHQDAGYLAQLIQEQGATVLQLVPSMLRVMLQEPKFPSCSTLRLVFCGGEALPADLQQRFYEKLGSWTSLWNLYGPTEATIDATFWECQPSGDQAIVPIGRPIANTQIYLLDAQQQPVPIGVVGELHIGGAGLARGYHNLAELTREKFIPNPFSDDPQARLYKTGDLARYRADGSIDYVGRMDFQVKVRGHRIELGEIETALGQHPALGGVVVSVREDIPGDQRLVAYFETDAEERLPTTELRNLIKQKLPEYMVPSAFVQLTKLPLTTNGKIDRRQLPAPDPARTEVDEKFQAPRNEVEETLTRIWREVLGLTRVGIEDNFFDLGGNSLIAVEVFDRTREELQLDLAIRLLFQYPTIKALADKIASDLRKKFSSGNSRGKDWRYLREFQPGKGNSPVYMVPGAISGEVDVEFFFYARLAHFVGADYPFYGLRPKGADGHEEPHFTVREMAKDYVDEIRLFQPNGPYYLAGACIGGVVAYEMACRLDALGERVFLALLDTVRPNLEIYLKYRTQPWLERYESCKRQWAENYYIQRAGYHWREVKQRSWDDRLAYLRRRGVSALSDIEQSLIGVVQGRPSPNVPAPQAEVQASREVMRFRRAYESALRRYRPRHYRGKIIMLNAEAVVREFGRCAGWKDRAGGPIEEHILPGDHISLFRQDVKLLAARLRDCLAAATFKHAGGKSALRARVRERSEVV